MRGQTSEEHKKMHAFLEWDASEDKIPRTQREFALSIGVTEQVCINWRYRFLKIDDEDEEKEIRQFKRKVFRDAIRPNATGKDKELYGRMKGLFIDKSEHKVSFVVDADEHFAIREEARRRVSEVSGGADGDRGLLPESPILSEEVREGTGQE